MSAPTWPGPPGHLAQADYFEKMPVRIEHRQDANTVLEEQRTGFVGRRLRPDRDQVASHDVLAARLRMASHQGAVLDPAQHAVEITAIDIERLAKVRQRRIDVSRIEPDFMAAGGSEVPCVRTGAGTGTCG